MARPISEQVNYLAWSACDKINHLVGLLGKDPDVEDWAAIHGAIQRVRSHLEARACQTATPLILPVTKTEFDMPGFDDLLPVEPQLMQKPAADDFSDLGL